MTKPLIAYYGGKQRIAANVVEVIDTIPHTVYFEPFFGGGAVFFKRVIPHHTNADHFREVINDKSELLMNLYRTAREHPEEFARLIEWTPYSESEHKRSVEICKSPDEHSAMDKAWAYYTNINQSFSHRLNGGWGRGVSSENLSTTWHNRRSQMPECLKRLKNVAITCDDAAVIIPQWDSPQTLFYCDPPYPNTDCGHYSGWTDEDHQQLCNALDNAQGSYILSGYDNPIHPKTFDERIEISTLCSASGKGKVGKNRDRRRAATSEEMGDRQRTEVLWIKDRSHNIRDELGVALQKQRYTQTDMFAMGNTSEDAQ